MLSFELDEQVTEEELNSIRLTSEYFYTAISKSIENDKDNKNYDNLKRAFEDSRSGINKKLTDLDERFRLPTKKDEDNVRKYEIFKLRKIIYNSEIENNEYKIFQLLDKTSYRSIYFDDEQLDTSQSEYLNKLNKSIIDGLNHQVRSNFKNITDFIYSVNKYQYIFVDIMNTAVTMHKRVAVYENGKYCTEDYYKSIYCLLDEIYNYGDELKSRSYTTFELFYQLEEARLAIGGSNSQIYINKHILDIIEKDIYPISKEASKKVETLKRYDVVGENSTLEEYIKKHAETFAPMVFDGEDIEMHKGIEKIEKNAFQISKYYEVSQKEFAKPNINSVDQYVLVALCRAFFVKEKNKASPYLKMIFSADGYFPKNDNEAHRSTLFKDVKNFSGSTGKIKKSSCRMILEIINLYICVYNNKVDYLKKRLELEIKFDEVVKKILSYYDFAILRQVLDKYYYKLMEIVLPNKFIAHSIKTNPFREETKEAIKEYVDEMSKDINNESSRYTLYKRELYNTRRNEFIYSYMLERKKYKDISDDPKLESTYKEALDIKI